MLGNMIGGMPYQSNRDGTPGPLGSAIAPMQGGMGQQPMQIGAKPFGGGLFAAMQSGIGGPSTMGQGGMMANPMIAALLSRYFGGMK